MTRQEYMKALKDALDFIQEEPRQTILDYYDEMISDRMEDGMDELSAVAAMEEIADIAARLREDASIPKAEEKTAPPEWTDEAMKFSSLAGKLMRTFEDLEQAGKLPDEPAQAAQEAAQAIGDARETIQEAADTLQENLEKAAEPLEDLFQSAKELYSRTKEEPAGKYTKRTCAYPVKDLRAVRLLGGEMPIQVKACEGSDAILTYYTCEDDPYQVTLEDGVLTLERLESRKGISRISISVLGSVFRMNWRDAAPTVELLLPKAALLDLEAATSNASIKVSGLSALCDTQLKTTNCRIEVTDVSCLRLNCGTTNARLVLTRVQTRKELTGKTTNSRIEAQELSAGGSIALTTTNSRIEARELSAEGGIALTTTNSHMLMEDSRSSQEIRLTTGNAGLEIWRSDAPNVLLKTSNGMIRGQLPGSQRDWRILSHTSNGRNSLPTDQPGGPKTLDAHTSNGAIDLHFDEK